MKNKYNKKFVNQKVRDYLNSGLSNNQVKDFLNSDWGITVSISKIYRIKQDIKLEKLASHNTDTNKEK